MSGQRTSRLARGIAVRHAGVFAAAFLMYLGVTLAVELFNRFARSGNCGPRWGVACAGGRGTLALGFVALLGGLLLLGRIVGTAGWSGPALPFGGVALLYGGAGAAWTLGRGALAEGHGTAGVLTLGLLAGLAAVLVALLLWQVVRAAHADGARSYLRYLFWYLEILPESKRKRRRLLRDRGVAAGEVRNGRIEPVTERERWHWRLFVALLTAGTAGGVALGRVLVALV